MKGSASTLIDYGKNGFAMDCIHLKACRRLCKIARVELKKQLKRNCNTKCSAYVSGNTKRYVTLDEALGKARAGAESIRGGYDEFDVWARQDFESETLGGIIEHLSERGGEE